MHITGRKECVYLTSAPLYASARSANVPCGSAACAALPRFTRCAAASGCVYYYSYSNGSSTDCVLANEVFTFGSGATVHASLSGAEPMGRGPAHCRWCPSSALPGSPTASRPSTTIRRRALSSSAILSPAAKSTPFVPSPSVPRLSSYYYLSLEGITVGDAALPIDPAVFGSPRRPHHRLRHDVHGA
ncbi:hypothetical protein EJB05_12018, partial [Eragrostis curvula]